MEMQQVRYFVALAQTLNFTQAADRCNVTQPALTRAIKALEAELGGELLRREGRSTHLTDLGRRMLPLLKQCYESALSAKAAARTHASAAAACAVGLSNGIDLRLIVDALGELLRAIPDVRLTVRRGDADQITALLKSGDIDLAIAGPLAERWDRLDVWPLFSEPYAAFLSREHPLSGAQGALSPGEIKGCGYLRLVSSDGDEEESARFEEAGLSPEGAHRVDTSHDLSLMVQTSRRAAVAPRSALQFEPLARREVSGLTLKREVAAFTVAGRPRSREAGALLALLRTTPWREAFDQQTA